jgi:hypothetical protein
MIRSSLFILLLCAACSPSEPEFDSQFCDCLSAGKELSDLTEQFFDRQPTKEEANKVKELKAIEKEACLDYQTMDGDLMRAKKADCDGTDLVEGAELVEGQLTK